MATTTLVQVPAGFTYLPMSRHEYLWRHVRLDDTILDVGCADNSVWKSSPFAVVTLDRHILEDNLEAGITACRPDVLGLAEWLPFGDASFDVVCCADILEHVNDPAVVLREAKRVAIKRILITVPAEHFWPPAYKPFQGGHHKRFYEAQSFAQEMFRTGLGVKMGITVYQSWTHWVADLSKR